MDDELIRALKDLARVYAIIDNTIKELLPRPSPLPRDLLIEKIYDLKPAKTFGIEEIAEELRRAGHEDLVNKILKDKREKILVGMLYGYGECGDAAYQAYKLLEKKYASTVNIIIDDFSTDALTIADTISSAKADRVAIAAIKRRGREPGIYTSKIEFRRVEGMEAVEEIRPSLEGLLDIDAVIRGLNVLLGEGEVTVIECEPGVDDCSDCTEKLVKAVEEYVSGFILAGGGLDEEK